MGDAHEGTLGRDVFLALAAVGWADGVLDGAEADAIVRTALEEGLELDEIVEIEQATRTPLALEELDIRKLSKADRLFVYAVATWMARLDGVVVPAESRTLLRLGDLLRIPARPREHAESIAREVGDHGEGVTPALYDLPRLRRTLQVRLGMAATMRAAERGDHSIVATAGSADGGSESSEPSDAS